MKSMVIFRNRLPPAKNRRPTNQAKTGLKVDKGGWYFPRHRGRTVAAAILLALANGGFAAQAEQHIFLVDVSGSMASRAPAQAKITQLELRKRWLKSWCKDRRDSVVTLMAFGSDIKEDTRICDLPGALGRANDWVDRLQIQKHGGTNLWAAVRKAVDRAIELTPNTPDRSVMVHVLTDGRDTSPENSNLDLELLKLPLARTVVMSTESAERGDFDLRVAAQIESNPAPTEPPPQSPASVPPPPATSRPSPSPAVVDSSPSPALTSPLGKPDDIVAFEIQEPRIVSSGQFVHFINKSSPAGGTCTWTLRNNDLTQEQKKNNTASVKTTADEGFWIRYWHWLTARELSHEKDAVAAAQSITSSEEITSAEEHPVFQFRNTETQPRSYTVLLTVARDGKKMTATPMTISVLAVQSPPSGWAKFISSVTAIFGRLGGTAGIVGVCGLLIKMWELKRNDKSAEKIQQNKRWLLAVSALTALALVAFLVTWPSSNKEAEVAAQQSATEAAARAQAIARSSAPVAPPTSTSKGGADRPIVINAPNERAAKEAADAVAPQPLSSPIPLLVLVILIGGVLLVRKWPQWRQIIAPAIVVPAFKGSPSEELREIDRLRSEETISPLEAAAFKAAIVERLRKQYGIRAGTVSSGPPPSSSQPSQ